MGKRYDDIADKVALVPNVRKKDNLYQGLAVLCTLLSPARSPGSSWAGS